MEIKFQPGYPADLFPGQNTTFHINPLQYKIPEGAKISEAQWYSVDGSMNFPATDATMSKEDNTVTAATPEVKGASTGLQFRFSATITKDADAVRCYTDTPIKIEPQAPTPAQMPSISSASFQLNKGPEITATEAYKDRIVLKGKGFKGFVFDAHIPSPSVSLRFFSQTETMITLCLSTKPVLAKGIRKKIYVKLDYTYSRDGELKFGHASSTNFITLVGD